jgi:hypothetical protein
MYGRGEAEASSAKMAKRNSDSLEQKTKEQEARREQGWSGRRRSVSSERTLLPEYAPPAYEDVVRNDARHA